MACLQFVTLFLAVGIVYLTWHPPLLSDDLDISWQLYLQQASLHGALFGKDIAFTFGPYHFGYCNFVSEGLLLPWLAVRGLICLTMAAALFGLIRKGNWSFPFALATALILAYGSTFELGLPVVSLLLAYRLCNIHRSGLPEFYLLLICLALVSLIKFSYFIAVVAVLGVLACETVARWRTFPTEFAIYLLALGGFWVVAGESPLDFPAYLANSLEVARGYSEAMAVWPLFTTTLYRYIPVLAALALLTYGIWRAGYRDGFWRLIPCGMLLCFAFLVFKAGFVRHDAHEIIMMGATLYLTVVCGICLWLHSQMPRTSSLVIASISLAVLPLIIMPGVFWSHHVWGVHDRLAWFPTRVMEVLKEDQPLGKHAERCHQALVEANPLPKLQGTVDTYTYRLSVAMAHGFEISNRPVIQSYSAYTPKLAEMNAAHLRGPRAPEHLLISWNAIDGRLPSLEDSLSWPEFLTRYESRSRHGTWLVLDRRKTPLTSRLVPISQGVLERGGRYEVDASSTDLVWAEVRLKPTMLRKPAVMLHKDVVTKITLRTDDGDREFRLLPSLAGAGFLLSPLVEDTDDFQQLIEERRGKAVSSFSVKARRAFFHSDIDVRLYRLELERPARERSGPGEPPPRLTARPTES